MGFDFYERGKCVLDFVCVKSDGSVSLHIQTVSRYCVTNGYSTVTDWVEVGTLSKRVRSCYRIHIFQCFWIRVLEM